jgi:hypothetical protein
MAFGAPESDDFIPCASSAQIDFLMQAKVEDPLAAESYILLARKEGRCCPCSRTDAAADQGSFASGCQRANHRASPGASADPAPITPLV